LKKWGDLEVSGQKSVASDQLAIFQQETASVTDHSLLTTDHLRSLWHESFIFSTYSTRVEADFARDRGEKLLQKYYDWWSQESRAVLAVEQSFKFMVDGVEISGRMDRVEQMSALRQGSGQGVNGQESGICVIDYKTSPPRSQEEVDADLQLSIYALAVQELYGESCAELVLLYLNENEVIERKTQRSDGQLTDARKQIAYLKERMSEEDFHPTPSAGVCRCCPYKGVCDVAAA